MDCGIVWVADGQLDHEDRGQGRHLRWGTCTRRGTRCGKLGGSRGHGRPGILLIEMVPAKCCACTLTPSRVSGAPVIRKSLMAAMAPRLVKMPVCQASNARIGSQLGFATGRHRQLVARRRVQCARRGNKRRFTPQEALRPPLPARPAFPSRRTRQQYAWSARGVALPEQSRRRRLAGQRRHSQRDRHGLL